MIIVDASCGIEVLEGVSCCPHLFFCFTKQPGKNNQQKHKGKNIKAKILHI
jgi:hypothetical protein